MEALLLCSSSTRSQLGCRTSRRSLTLNEDGTAQHDMTRLLQYNAIIYRTEIEVQRQPFKARMVDVDDGITLRVVNDKEPIGLAELVDRRYSHLIRLDCARRVPEALCRLPQHCNMKVTLYCNNVMLRRTLERLSICDAVRKRKDERVREQLQRSIVFAGVSVPGLPVCSLALLIAVHGAEAPTAPQRHAILLARTAHGSLG